MFSCPSCHKEFETWKELTEHVNEIESVLDALTHMNDDLK